MGDLKPLRDDLPFAARQLAEEMRDLLAVLGVSLNRYAARKYLDHGSVSRFLSGERIPPWEFIHGLLVEATEHRDGVPPTQPVIEHMMHLRRAALEGGGSPLHQVQLLQDRLHDADREASRAAARERELRDALQAAQHRVAELLVSEREAQVLLDVERDAHNTELALYEHHLDAEREGRDALTSRIKALTEELQIARQRLDVAERRCGELERQLEYALRDEARSAKQQTMHVRAEGDADHVGMLERPEPSSERGVIVFTGLSELTLPLLKRLAETADNSGSIVVIEPSQANPQLDEARFLGVQVVIGNPASTKLLSSIISAPDGCALTGLYALREKFHSNEEVIKATERLLSGLHPDLERQPHLVTLIDDPRHADHWRGTHIGQSDAWFENALSAAETTAHALVSQVLRTGPRDLLICGDSPLTLAILLELARRAWEQAELVKAATIGVLAGPDAPLPFAVERVSLLDVRASDISREYLQSAPGAIIDSLPKVVQHPVRWRDHLLRTLDAMDPVQARETAVIIAESPPGSGVHEAGRVARLHRDTPVFVLAPSGDGMGGAIFDCLHLFEPALLIDGEVPEDTWTRVARHWHECYRLSHPLPPGHPQSRAHVPWSELDPFLRLDNVLELRTILLAVVARGRQWALAHLVPDGSVIELSESDLTEIAATEHTRWQQRRLADGHSGEFVVSWEALTPGLHSEVRGHLRSQLAQLEDLGFVPIVPAGGPPEAANFERMGQVQASQLGESLVWTTQAGEQIHGFAGDWRVIDDAGNMQTVTDSDFRAGHEPIGGGNWRRVGRDRAWRVSEAVVVRTKEGRAAARPGDWVVEAPVGARWPVSSEQFDRSYRPIPGRKSLSGQWHRRHARHENYPQRFLIPSPANGTGFPHPKDFLRDPASTSDHCQ